MQPINDFYRTMLIGIYLYRNFRKFLKSEMPGNCQELGFKGEPFYEQPGCYLLHKFFGVHFGSDLGVRNR